MKKEYDLKKMKGYRRPGKAKAAPDSTALKTFRFPLDLLSWLEKEAEKDGIGYQTKMFLILRRAMQSESGKTLEDRVAALEAAAKRTG